MNEEPGWKFKLRLKQLRIWWCMRTWQWLHMGWLLIFGGRLQWKTKAVGRKFIIVHIALQFDCTPRYISTKGTVGKAYATCMWFLQCCIKIQRKDSCDVFLTLDIIRRFCWEYMSLWISWSIIFEPFLLMRWHDMGIETPSGSNDPFCGHLRVDGVMKPLEMVIILKKVWNPCTW